MNLRLRVVLDTNAMVSRLLLPDSIPAKAVRRAIAEGTILVSDATIRELDEVLSREKFDQYVSIEDRKAFLREFGRVAERVSVVTVVRACRDPKNDKLLEAAVNGAADIIVSGNADLPGSNPFRRIRIVSPANFFLHIHAVDVVDDDPAASE
jgi:putative PIN family toxin of toxin-antitoxin system